MIYFDNAATSWPKPPKVIQSIILAIDNAGNPGRSSHKMALWSTSQIYKVREKIADLFCIEDPLRISFTQNASIALNFAINMCQGEIITTSMDHNSVLRNCHTRGWYTVVPADMYGNLNSREIIDAITPFTGAVVMTHASNLVGNIYDIEEIGKACSKRNVLFIVDAAQTAGVVPIDVGKMHIDILCFTGHKSLMGPQGTGGIYLAPNLKPKVLLKGGTGSRSNELNHPIDMPDCYEVGTPNTHGIVGLGAGIDYITSIGIENIWHHEQKLTRYFTKGLNLISNCKIYGDYTSPNVGIVSLNISNIDSSEVCYALAQNDICVRGGIHCAPLAHKSLGTIEQGAVRFSFGYSNTEKEIDIALKVLSNISAGL